MDYFSTWLFPDSYFNLISISQRTFSMQRYLLPRFNILSISPKPVKNVMKQNKINIKNLLNWGFSGGPPVKNPPCNAGDTGSIPGPGRSHMPWNN